jgi:hypothetical protein
MAARAVGRDFIGMARPLPLLDEPAKGHFRNFPILRQKLVNTTLRSGVFA